MIDFSRFKSLFAVMNFFKDERVCKQTLADARWNGDVVCPYCGEHHCVTRKDGRYRCKKCRRNFSVLVGTIFENTNLPLYKWFVAMYLISSHKKGVSSYQLGRDIEVSQTTAWFMLHKIRSLFKQDASQRMSGCVECDEVYIGGKEKWKHKSMRTPNTQGRSTETKTPVFGILERTFIINDKNELEKMSYVHAFVLDKVNKDNVHTLIGQFVDNGSVIMTDELNCYKGLNCEGYQHRVVNHGIGEFVNKDDDFEYTNSIEGFWSHFRRMIAGCYHDVSDEHLQSYIDEMCYRWNTRKKKANERFEQMFNMSVGLIVTWDELKMCA